MVEYFDSHAHLGSPEFEDDLDEVLERAREAGVTRFIVPGGDMEENRRILGLAERRPEFHAAVGVHPNALADEGGNWLEELRAMVASGRVFAIGETGLDLYRKRVPLRQQVKALYAHLELAAAHELPVVIHQREAADEMIRALREFSLEGGRIRGVMHCFSGEPEYLEGVLAYDLFVSFAGPITYPRNRKLRGLVPLVPEDRLLIETDSPYLPPQKHRGGQNEPAFITEVAGKVAECFRLLPEDIARITYRNALRLLDLPVDDGQGRIVYPLRNSLYVNLTNRCNNSCVFCPRNRDWYEIRGHNLRLENEPGVEDILGELEKALASGEWREVVFCGLGEPVLRLDVLLDVAKRLKGRVPLRLDTNGQVLLYRDREVATRLGEVLDAVSVSLNTSDAGQYVELCRPEKGGAAYAAILDFVRLMAAAGVTVTVTAVDYPGVDTERFAAQAKELGVRMRVRDFVR